MKHARTRREERPLPRSILVTGSSGTIGTRLCERLLEKGYRVTGVDRVRNRWSTLVDAHTIQADLRDEAAVAALPSDADLIIHLAANARVYNLVVEPSLARDNFNTTFNVLEHARRNGIKRFIFASSREVYGNSQKERCTEDDAAVEHCESSYTASKIGGEALVRAYEQCYGISFIICRFSNVYGMYDISDRVVPLFISNCLQGKDLHVYGKEKLLDFTYIDDAVGGVCSCIERFAAVKNDTFNLAYGEGVALLRTAELVREHMGADSGIILGENRTGEVVRYVADITKAAQRLGYRPLTSIERGIAHSVAWYRANAAHLPLPALSGDATA